MATSIEAAATTPPLRTSREARPTRTRLGPTSPGWQGHRPAGRRGLRSGNRVRAGVGADDHGAVRASRCSGRQPRAGLSGRHRNIERRAVATTIEAAAPTPPLRTQGSVTDPNATGPYERWLASAPESQPRSRRRHDLCVRLALVMPRNSVQHTTNDMRAQGSGLSNRRWRAHRLSGPC